jgi:hypothetical protein
VHECDVGFEVRTGDDQPHVFLGKSTRDFDSIRVPINECIHTLC